MILGLDTSCYTTSAALYDGQSLRQSRRLLTVAPGQKGLRQSDALFQHITRLPELLSELGDMPPLSAVAASSRPRAIEGSYMPVFLAGLQAARILSQTLRIPLHEVSHQQGHLAAALLSIDRLELADAPFLAWHVSGGTTELLLVEPFYQAKRIGGTGDVCAGQIIDRVGVLLGLPFPAGPALDNLSQTAETEPRPGRLTVTELEFSLSGLQNQAERLHSENAPPEQIARFTLKMLAEALAAVTDRAQTRYPGLPVVGCGGVLANTLIRAALGGVLFAEPQASSDNAAGVACLGHLLHIGQRENRGIAWKP